MFSLQTLYIAGSRFLVTQGVGVPHERNRSQNLPQFPTSDI